MHFRKIKHCVQRYQAVSRGSVECVFVDKELVVQRFGPFLEKMD